MKKVNIQICSLGVLPRDLNRKSLSKMKSKIFDVESDIHSYELRADSDLYEWSYSDLNLAKQISPNHNSDILVVLTSVPLEMNYYTRRLNDNIVVFSFYEIGNFLKFDNIPLENIVKRLLYAYSLAFLRNGNRIPTSDELTKFTHDDARGCIYDMNGVKEDISTSCHKPIVCDECCERMKIEHISSETIDIVKSELRKIKKDRYYVISDWVKKYPIFALILSSAWVIGLGVLGSILANAVSRT